MAGDQGPAVGVPRRDAALRRSWGAVTPGLWLSGDLAQIPDAGATVTTLEATAMPSDLAGVTEPWFPLRDSRWEQVPRPVVDAVVHVMVAAEGAAFVRRRCRSHGRCPKGQPAHRNGVG